MAPTSDCSDPVISHVNVKDGDPELREGILHVHATKLPDDDAYVITKFEQRLYLLLEKNAKSRCSNDRFRQKVKTQSNS